MNYAFFLAPVFLDWAVEVMRSIKTHDPAARFTALCSNTKIYKKTKSHWPDFFISIEDFEGQEKTWLAESDSAQDIDDRIAHYDQLLGPGVLQRVIVADRHLGAGYITGADVMHSKLFHATRCRESLLQYIVRLMDYIDDYIVRSKVDCFFIHGVASGPALAFGELCRVRGVRFLHLQPTRINDRFIVDSSIKGLCAEISDAYLNAKNNPEVLKEYKPEAAQILESCRTRQIVPEYVTYSKNLLKKAHSPLSLVKGTARAAAKFVLYPFIYGETGLRAGNHFDDFIMTFRKPVRFRLTKNRPGYADPKTLKDRSFIYFPLHVDPEASTMVVAPDHTNQLAVIENLSKKAPLNMPIVVKEHPPMVGVRPLWFYKRLAAIPNVILIDPYQNSLELMKRAGLIVTISGTIAWEAMVFGRPVLITGASPFRVVEQGFVFYGDVTELDDAIQKALKLKPANDDALTDYIAATLKVSFPLPMKLLWGNPDKKTIAAHKDVTDRVAREIVAGAKR